VSIIRLVECVDERRWVGCKLGVPRRVCACVYEEHDRRGPVEV
jgi:hypothetical protein